MGAAAEDLLFGDDDEAFAGKDHAAAERADHDGGVVLVLAVAGALDALVEPGGVERGGADATADVLMTEQRGEALGLRLRARGEEHAEAAVLEVGDAPRDRGEGARASLGRTRRLDRAREVLVVGGREMDDVARHLVLREALALARDGGAVKDDHAMRVELADDLALGEEERLGQELRLGRLRGGVLRGAAELVEDDARDGGRIGEDEASLLGQVLVERDERVVVRRQIRVGAEERATGRDVVDEDARLHRRPVDHVGELRRRAGGRGRRAPSRGSCRERAAATAPSAWRRRASSAGVASNDLIESTASP